MTDPDKPSELPLWCLAVFSSNTSIHLSCECLPRVHAVDMLLRACVWSVVRNEGWGDTQQDQSYRQDGARVPSASVSAKIFSHLTWYQCLIPIHYNLQTIARMYVQRRAQVIWLYWFECSGIEKVGNHKDYHCCHVKKTFITTPERDFANYINQSINHYFSMCLKVD